MAREDNYDQPQALFPSLIDNISHENIKEVWKVVRHRSQQASPQYVIILDDGSHLCTCLWLINQSIVCRHFFKVMSYSQNAYFHITLIPQRWYNDKKARVDQQIYSSIATYQIIENKLNQLPSQPLLFNHLTNIRKLINVEQK